jgi:hypothetical protein
MEGMLKGLGIDAMAQGKVIEVGRNFEHFEFDIATDGGKEMVGLRIGGVSRGLGKRGILLEGFVKGFDVPSFLIATEDSKMNGTKTI